MQKHTEKFLMSDISSYIEEFVFIFNNDRISLQNLSICNLALQSVFLKLIGAVEQKIYNLKWYIGFNDLDVRRKIQEDFTRQSTNQDSLNKSYELFIHKLKEYNNTLNFPSSIWGNSDLLEKSYNKTYEIFSKSSIIDYTGSQFYEFTQNSPLKLFFLHNKLHKSLKYAYSSKKKSEINKKIQNIDNEVSKYINMNKKFFKNLPSKSKFSNIIEKSLDIYYDRLIHHRHALAHNFISVKMDLPLLKDILHEMYKYDTYYYRFMICIYLDFIIQDIFMHFKEIQEEFSLIP